MSIYRCSIRFTLKKSLDETGLLSVFNEEGIMEFATDQGVEYTWPLEAFGRHRRNPKMPMVHLQFDLDFDQEAVSKIRTRSVELQVTRKDVVLTFAEEESRDNFLTAFLNARTEWSQIVQNAQALDDQKTKRKYVQAYEELLDKLKAERAAAEELKAASRTEQFLMAKQVALEGDSALALLYNDLVVQRGVLTDDEFWTRHSEALAGSMPLPSPDENFYFPPAKGTTQLSLDKLAVLLTESTVIRKRYDELVKTSKLSDSEFWSRLFHSKFYAKLTGMSVVKAQEEPFFDAPEIEEPDGYEQMSSVINPATAVTQLISPDIQLANMDHVRKEGFGLKDYGDALFQNRESILEEKNNKKKSLSLFDRFNRHASRTLQARLNASSFYSADSEQKSTLPINEIPSAESLGVMATLISLENALSGKDDVPRLNLDDTVSALNAQSLRANVDYKDLKTENETNEASPKSKQVQNRVLALPHYDFDQAQYANWLADETSKFELDVSPASNELVATCCFVKYTTSLRGAQDIEKNKLFAEALLQSEHLVDLFNTIADLQAKVKELLYFIHNPTKTDTTSNHRFRDALLKLKEDLEVVRRKEIDAGGNRKLMAIINTRTLCQPILHAIDSALMLPSLRAA